MATRVKFIIEADATKLAAEQKRVLAGQEKIERGFGDQAKASEDAGRRETAAAKKTADAYDLADRRMQGAVRTRSASSTYTRPRVYGMTPASAPPAMTPGGPAVPAYGGAYQYRLARSEQEQFTRFNRARDLRELRGGEREFAAGAGLRDFQHRMTASRWDRDKASGVRDYDVHDPEGRRAARAERAEELRQQRRGQRTADEQKRDAARREKRRAARRQFGREAGGAVAGYFGAQQVASLVGDTFEGVRGHYTKMGEGLIALEDEIGPLVSLNNENLKNFSQVKQRAIDTSIATGFHRPEVIQARYNFEQSATGIPEDKQAELWEQAQILTKVKGGSLDENATAVNKLWQNYGDKFNSVREAVSTMAFIEAEGSIDMRAIAKELPDAMGVWDAYGKSFAELGAAVQVVTTSMGDPLQAVTQLRNLPGRLLKADKVLGIKTSGDTHQRLTQIKGALAGKSEDEQGLLIKKIAEEQGAAALTILLRDLDQFDAAEAKIKKTGPDYLSGLQAKRYEDPAYQTSETLKSIRAFQENIPAIAAQDPEHLKALETFEAVRTGLMFTNKDKPWITPAETDKAAMATMAAGAPEQSKEAQLGFSKLYDALLAQATGLTDKGARDDVMLRSYQFSAGHGVSFGLKDADGSFINDEDKAELRRIYDATGDVVSPEKLGIRHAAEERLRQARANADVMRPQAEGGPGAVRPEDVPADPSLLGADPESYQTIRNERQRLARLRAAPPRSAAARANLATAMAEVETAKRLVLRTRAPGERAERQGIPVAVADGSRVEWENATAPRGSMVEGFERYVAGRGVARGRESAMADGVVTAGEAAEFGKQIDRFAEVIGKLDRAAEKEVAVANTKGRNAHR